MNKENRVTREFLDWSTPPLLAASEWLIRRYRVGNEVDLADVIAVLPTAQAGRRLVEQLLMRCEEDGLLLAPPHTLTIGSVPELLYHPEKPLASGLLQSLAWVRALRETPRESLLHFTRLVPEPADISGWRALGSLLANWHAELAAHGLQFEDVLDAGDRVEIFQEHDRWQVLGDIQRRYLDILTEAGYWDQQTARLVAIEKRECRTDRSLILVGLVDLSPVFRQMLDQVAEHVTALVFCGPDTREGFDEIGCLVPDSWKRFRLNPDDSDIQLASHPADLARQLVRELAALDGKYAPEEICISVPDRRLISPIERAFLDHQVACFDAGGESVRGSGPPLLLDLINGWLRSESFDAFARLVRHPDIYDWLTRIVGSDSWLAELDRWQNARLPFFVPPSGQGLTFEGKDYRGNAAFPNLEIAWSAIQQLFAPFVSDDGKALRAEMAVLADSWRSLLREIYGDMEVDPQSHAGRVAIQSLQTIVAALEEFTDARRIMTEPVDGTDVLDWVQRTCVDAMAPVPPELDALALSGWLETPWETAPVVMVTCMNEGWVPSVDASNLFIPNSIRSALGMVDNERRLARDAWALGMLGRSSHVIRYFVLRHDEDGQPLMPSRLLFRDSDEKRVADRALRLFGEGESIPWNDRFRGSRPTTQQLAIPRPFFSAAEQNSMRVTDFGAFLQCPYRFYLTRVLQLERVADDQDELDAAAFGTLLHDVVEAFGRSAQRDATDAEVIESSVLGLLDEMVAERFGATPAPAVSIQVAQARLRLKGFAEWQSQHRRDGFEIYAVEQEKTRATIDLDGKPFVLRGQIDRIDVNHTSRTIGVYDYKTGEHARTAREYHQTKDGEWINLQLPLYEKLLVNFDLPEGYAIEYGLIFLSRDSDEIRLERADWTESELADAWTRAEEIMRLVRANAFWPMEETSPSAWLDDLDVICQTGLFQRWSDRAAATSVTEANSGTEVSQ